MLVHQQMQLIEVVDALHLVAVPRHFDFAIGHELGGGGTIRSALGYPISLTSKLH
jgi:hypothetical protein